MRYASGPANDQPWRDYFRVSDDRQVHLAKQATYYPGTVFPAVELVCGVPEGMSVGDRIVTPWAFSFEAMSGVEHLPVCPDCIGRLSE